jgi:hypothetical protein
MKTNTENLQKSIDELVCYGMLTKENTGYHTSVKFNKVFARFLDDKEDVKKALLLSVIELAELELEEIVDYAQTLSRFMDIEGLEELVK